MKNIFYGAALILASLVAVISFTPALTVHAAGLTVTPAVIDDHGLPRDILTYNLTVTNTDDHMVYVFASVYNLTADGKQDFQDTSIVNTSVAEKSVSLANWIDVSRGSMTFEPGETKTIPVTINVNPFATAGTYHAVIAFVEGGTRADAETHLDGAPQALVNLEVQSNSKEELSLVSFASTNRFASAFPVNFAYTLQNTGNVSSTPTGLVIFYDRLGHELGSVDANPDQVSIAPGETQDFTVQWGNGGGFGQYKAMLDLTYGAAGNKLQDVALVWVLPWIKVLMVFLVLLVLVIIVAVWVHRRYERGHYTRMHIIEQLLAEHAKPVHRASMIKSGGNADNVLDLRNLDQSHENH